MFYVYIDLYTYYDDEDNTYYDDNNTYYDDDDNTYYVGI